MFLISAVVDNSCTPVRSASPDSRWLFTPIVPMALEPGDYVMAAVWGNPTMGADRSRLNTTAVSSYALPVRSLAVCGSPPGRSRVNASAGREVAFLAPTWPHDSPHEQCERCVAPAWACRERWLPPQLRARIPNVCREPRCHPVCSLPGIPG
jgi:hypothetical protein